jgi:hypothetical protein
MLRHHLPLKSYRKKHKKFPIAEVNSNFTEKKILKKKQMRSCSRMKPIEPALPEKKMYTFLKLETTVSVQCSPWFFT